MKGKNYEENAIMYEVRILHVLSHLICLKLNFVLNSGSLILELILLPIDCRGIGDGWDKRKCLEVSL